MDGGVDHATVATHHVKLAPKLGDHNPRLRAEKDHVRCEDPEMATGGTPRSLRKRPRAESGLSCMPRPCLVGRRHLLGIHTIVGKPLPNAQGEGYK